MKRWFKDDERFVVIGIGGLALVTFVSLLLLAALSARSPKLVLNRADWTCTETVSETHYYTQYIEAGEVDIPVIQPVTTTECVNYRRTGGDE